MRRDVVVLCYHGISDTWPDQTAVRAEDFAAQIEMMIARGYRGQTFGAAVAAPASERVFAVTFDDAPLSVYERAAPILADLGVPATVFVATRFTSEGVPASWQGLTDWLGTEHERELECMNWEQLGVLREDGWEIGSHTQSHPRLSTLAPEQVRTELRESRRECELHLGAPCLTLAYPYGESDQVAAREARSAGYTAAATVPTSATAPHALLWPRVGVYNGDSARRVWLRSRSRRLGLTPGAQPLLSAAGRTARAVSARVRRG